MVLPNNMARVRRESLNVEAADRPGWYSVDGSIPAVGDSVYCIEGEGEVVKVLGKIGDGGRLLEICLPDRPKVPFFASSTNVLVQTDQAKD